MSWSCSFTGISGFFNDRQRIGIRTSCSNPASTVDFVNAAVQSDLRTLIVEPGTEEAVKVAVAKACERKVSRASLELGGKNLVGGGNVWGGLTASGDWGGKFEVTDERRRGG